MSNILLEIVVSAGEAAAQGITSRDEMEDPLEAALAVAGVGEVTGGGGGSGVFILDVEVASEEAMEPALAVIRGVLQDLKVPRSTVIKRQRPSQIVFPVYV